MAYTVDIAPLAATAVIGATTNFTATGSGAAAEGTESFVWTVDGVPQSSVTAAMDYVAVGPAGSKTIKVVATTTPADGEPETAEAETTLTIQNKTMSDVSVTLTPESINVPEGTPASFKADVVGAPAGATFAYSWKKDGSPVDGTTDTLVIDTSAEGSQVIEVSVVVSATDYDPATVTKTGNVTVTAKVAPVPDGELPYVHPLPVRNSAYIWVGWWVMDEIQKMTLEGKDWKTDDPDSPYYLHRYTLQKMITDYSEVDVQESRNGRIIHRTALEAGIIYDYVY